MTDAVALEQTPVNNPRTDAIIDAPLTQPRSRSVPMDFEQTRRDLMAIRVKHGADSPIGHRVSNIIELMQEPKPPTRLIERQMADLQRLLRDVQ
jgi:hypothetical protein